MPRRPTVSRTGSSASPAIGFYFWNGLAGCMSACISTTTPQQWQMPSLSFGYLLTNHQEQPVGGCWYLSYPLLFEVVSHSFSFLNVVFKESYQKKHQFSMVQRCVAFGLVYPCTPLAVKKYWASIFVMFNDNQHLRAFFKLQGRCSVLPNKSEIKLRRLCILHQPVSNSSRTWRQWSQKPWDRFPHKSLWSFRF